MKQMSDRQNFPEGSEKFSMNICTDGGHYLSEEKIKKKAYGVLLVEIVFKKMY